MRVKNKQTLYLDETFGHEDSLLLSLKKEAEEEGVSSMQISPHEGRILQILVKMSKSRKIVEIGSLYGYSTVYMARALPENGRIFTCDISEKRHQTTKRILKSSPEYHKIQWITGTALETLKTIETQGPFDMIFIDADKASYGHYLDWAEKHLRTGGVVAADNTFLFGAVFGESVRDEEYSDKALEVMESFNKRLSQSDLWTGALIPTSEGLTVAIKK